MIGLRKEFGAVMTDELTDGELLRYSRQILLDDWDMDAQIRLSKSCVLIVGVGGLGCPVSQILVRSGVGRVHLVDFDEIDESNLQRQSLFYQEHIGLSKAKIAHEQLTKHNEWVCIGHDHIKLTDETIFGVLDKVAPDLVIDCTDNFKIRDLLNKACHQQSIPLLSNSAIAEVGQIALFSQETGCYHCVFGDEDGDEQTCATSGVLSSTVHIVGSMSAQIALDFLGRGNNPIAGKLILWHGKQFALTKLTFKKDPHCPVCGLSRAHI